MNSQGLEIYEQVHQNEMNRFIHLAFLPMVFYGLFRAVHHSMIPIILASYTGYYIIAVDAYSALTTVFTISPWALLASKKIPSLKLGIALMTTSLVIQEVIGHSLFEQINSRMTFEFVGNAILYSPLFYSAYISTWLYMFQHLFTLYVTS